MQGQSELAQLLQIIGNEWSAAFQGLHGLSRMASHQFINARYSRIGESKSELVQLVDEDKAIALVVERLEKQ